MKRKYALGILALLAVLGLLLAARKGGEPVVGTWEAQVELSPGDETTPAVRGFVRYVFAPDGSYTLSAAKERSGLENAAQRQGRYYTEKNRLYLSAGLEYTPDPNAYELYTLEKDALIIDRGTAGAIAELYPLRLTKIPEP